MSKLKSTTIPGELVFKLYDTHGFQEDVIQRMADLYNLKIDKQGFWQLLTKHRTRHKTAYKEQSQNKAMLFTEAIKQLQKEGYQGTNDTPKYDYSIQDGQIHFKTLKTKIIAILNEDLTWIDVLDPCENRTYYIVTRDSNFYCEEGGQLADDGMIYIRDNVALQVESVFKIQDFVFHKGFFGVGGGDKKVVRRGHFVELEINEDRRLRLMRNHTGVHLLNAAIRKVLPNSVVCPVGSRVSENGLSLNLSVYGEKVSPEKVMDAQNLIR